MVDSKETAPAVASAAAEALATFAMPPRRCGTCQAYVESETDKKKGGPKGDCRNAPPSVTIIPIPGHVQGTVNFITQSAWPVVQESQFCVTGYQSRLN